MVQKLCLSFLFPKINELKHCLDETLKHLKNKLFKLFKLFKSSIFEQMNQKKSKEPFISRTKYIKVKKIEFGIKKSTGISVQ